MAVTCPKCGGFDLRQTLDGTLQCLECGTANVTELQRLQQLRAQDEQLLKDEKLSPEKHKEITAHLQFVETALKHTARHVYLAGFVAGEIVEQK